MSEINELLELNKKLDEIQKRHLEIKESDPVQFAIKQAPINAEFSNLLKRLKEVLR